MFLKRNKANAQKISRVCVCVCIIQENTRQMVSIRGGVVALI